MSIDTIAEAADRTSGAVYAHFGGKDGLLSALLENLVNESASVMDAELSVAPTAESPSDEHLAALWRTFASPPPGPSAGWMLLEHELWLRAARDPELTAAFARRYAWSRRQFAGGVASRPDHADEVTAEGRATLVLALLLGLEMQRRLDPAAVPDSLAVAGLERVLGHTAVPPPPTKDTEEETHAHAAL